MAFALRAALLLVAALLFWIPQGPVFAQGKAVKPEQSNWARDVVAARVYVRSVQSLILASRGQRAPNIRERQQQQIIGGTAATEFQNPFQVALLLRERANNQNAFFCGGTLIGPRHVVTAAHCSDFVNADQVQVLTGTRRLNGTGTRVNVARIDIHPDFDAMTLNNDVAVWTLDRDQFLFYAELANQDGPVGGQMLLTGWGLTRQTGSPPVALQALQLPLVDRGVCIDAYRGEITDSMLCAGRAEAGQNACRGDSGGPLTRGLNNGVLTGIVSWGRALCAQRDQFSVYTRVSEPTIRQFIERIVPSPVLSGSASPASIDGFGTATAVAVTVSGEERRVWGSGLYADVRATANGYCRALGRAAARTWEANSCGVDESSYVRFNSQTNRWEFRDSGSSNNEEGFCRYPLLSSVTCD